MIRRLIPLLLVLVLAPWTAASADDHPLSIVFSANSGGHYEPCPVCGGKAMGGLGRRATLFARQREAGGNPLFLAGPYEFLPPSGLKNPTPQLAQALGKAYGTLGYDAIFAAPEEDAWLRDSDAELPPVLHLQSNRAEIVTLDKGGCRIGVVLFPRLLRGERKPTPMVMESVARKARSLAERTDIVIGVSSWGAAGEAEFLDKTEPCVDVLLGSGFGPGLAGRFMKNGRTFWARAYTTGKAFHVIRVRVPDQREPDWRWIKDGNLSLDFQVLDKDVTSDAAMLKLLDGFSLGHVN
ncbi:UshA-like (seleno)protein family 2 [Desulfocurvus sp. DL9XJH121]